MVNKFSPNEIDFLSKLEISQEIKSKLKNPQIKLSEDDYEALYEATTECLQLKGLDKNYADNEIGKQARPLIDKINSVWEAEYPGK